MAPFQLYPTKVDSTTAVLCSDEEAKLKTYWRERAAWSYSTPRPVW